MCLMCTVHSARGIDGWHVPRPIDVSPWKRCRCCATLRRFRNSRLVSRALLYRALRSARTINIPLHPYFHHTHQLAEYLHVSAIAFVNDYVTLPIWSGRPIKHADCRICIFRLHIYLKEIILTFSSFLNIAVVYKN